jgi:hypothetical protein
VTHVSLGCVVAANFTVPVPASTVFLLMIRQNATVYADEKTICVCAATAWICWVPVGFASKVAVTSSLTSCVNTLSGPAEATGSGVPWMTMLSTDTGWAARVIVTFADGATMNSRMRPTRKTAPAMM